MFSKFEIVFKLTFSQWNFVKLGAEIHLNPIQARGVSRDPPKVSLHNSQTL